MLAYSPTISRRGSTEMGREQGRPETRTGGPGAIGARRLLAPEGAVPDKRWWAVGPRSGKRTHVRSHGSGCNPAPRERRQPAVRDGRMGRSTNFARLETYDLRAHAFA